MLLLASRPREWTRLPKGECRAGGEEGFGDATLKYSVEGEEEQALMTELAA